INNRGVQMPAPSAAQGFWPFWLAVLAALLAVMLLSRWASARRHATGRSFPLLWTSVALLVAIPTASGLLWGAPFDWEVPQLQRFNIRGGWVVIPELVWIVLALSISTAAFIGETVRAGIQAVSHGQSEAAASLGLRSGQILRLVIVPQALRVIVPPLTSQYLNLAKNSSLAAAIGYP